MDLWGCVADLMLRLIDEYDDLAIFLWLLVEETGFPLPLPGDLAMLLAGDRVAQGLMHPLWALVLVQGATLEGGEEPALGIGPPKRSLVRFFAQGAARFADGNAVRFVAVVIALVVVSELVWAVVYSHLPAPLRRLPPWLRGLAFSVVPLSCSLFVLLPLLGAGPLGLGLDAGLLPFAGEAVRNALYGVGQATSYSLLRAARQRPTRAAEIGALAAPEREPYSGASDGSGPWDHEYVGTGEAIGRPATIGPREASGDGRRQPQPDT